MMPLLKNHDNEMCKASFEIKVDDGAIKNPLVLDKSMPILEAKESVVLDSLLPPDESPPPPQANNIETRETVRIITKNLLDFMVPIKVQVFVV